MILQGAELVADTDPWLDRTWKVYAVQGSGSPYLKPSDKEGAFTLSAVPGSVSGQVAYYTVDFVGENMPPCWQGLLLFPHGSVAFPLPVPLLPPWTKSVDATWLAAANTVRQGLNDSMARLEGVLNPGTNAANLTLVCVSDATTSGMPLLVLKIASTAAVAGAASAGSIPAAGIGGGGHGDN
jgi:hypothetical protein